MHGCARLSSPAITLFSFAFVLSAFLLGPRQAKAEGLSSCGDIQVQAEAQCEVTGGVTCEAMCTPISVRAACSAKLALECDGQCTAQASVACNTDCRAQCTGSCEVDPGKFECQGSCEASCMGDCSASCAASGNKAQCEASCSASCGATCQGSCEVEPPTASCDARCEASCSGSCEAKANIDCQIDCQSELYAECEVDLQGGCKVDCEAEEGALFCDGKYVDHGDNLAQCVAALEAFIDANVEGYASGSAACEGGTCQAEGEAGVSCAASPSQRGSAGAGWMALCMSGFGLLIRRKSR